MVGQTVSHYKILEHVGGGGMGVVYKARDLKLDREVALKFLPPEFTRDPDAKQRFMQEAKTASLLQHPNICTIHDIDQTEDGQIFIVMDLYEGETLKSKLERGPASIDEAVEITLQMARGLAGAHENGIVHRDIKPANVIVTRDGLVKIVDFGLAKLTGLTMLTKVGSTIGTAAYMSPEQARGGEIDQRTDVWSLGVVLFEMLTGRLPFRGDHESAIIYSILNEECEPVTTLRPDVPDPLARIVTSMLQKDQTLRTPSMTRVLEELSPLQSKEAAAPGTPQILKRLKRPLFVVPVLILLAALCLMAYWWIDRSRKISWAREQAIPQIEKLGGEEKWSAVYILAKSAHAIIPGDPTLAKLQEWFLGTASITSDPPGAHILWRAYSDSTAEWLSLGETPVSGILFPRGTSIVRLEKEGFEPFEGPVSGADLSTTSITLDRVGTLPSGMIHIPAGKYVLDVPGLENIDSATVSDYYIDRYEVTNRQFREFVSAGGYQNRQYWKYPFKREGKELTWNQAMAVFLDATGRPGPATWEVGSYPEGKADHPVCGVSWYEAAAYSEYAGKSLPTIFHWNIVAGTEFSSEIVPRSNFASKGTAAVGTYRGISRFGAFDMAGNAREWCWNESRGNRYILGGGWNDLEYTFNDGYTQDPFDRSSTNGFRCIKYTAMDGNKEALERVIDVPARNLANEHPASDETFRYYRSLYNYDRIPLKATIESTDSTHPDWTVQKIVFTAAYGNEKMAGFLFLPPQKQARYQVVVFYPGSDAIYNRTANPSVMPKDFDFILRNGRAVFFPIYKSTFERGDGLKSDIPSVTNSWKDHMIMWVKDLSRSIDYLETRQDIDCSNLAYYGVSWGGAMGGIIPAVETRIKVVVLHVAGLSLERSLPEVDPLNYVSRVKKPVLMLNGQYDHYFPVETSMKPMFRLLGTPAEQKRSVLYPTGHAVPRNQLIREVLDWLDHYLGPVQ
jgi:tRNA A-37 threonylcarbamoyl transferase component Bud32/pimeloyl-ACP methyl ester carboxylesterase